MCPYRRLVLSVEQTTYKRKESKHLSWIEQSQTIHEIGSTFTVQGFDLNYVGVIIGPSVKYRDGKIIFDISESKNKSAVQNRKLESGEMINYGETLLRNELNVLLTRGVNGLYVYAVDEELQQALKMRQNKMLLISQIFRMIEVEGPSLYFYRKGAGMQRDTRMYRRPWTSWPRRF